ncbi:MAG: PEP-CTERM sorting domain-containing protein [Opitutales bacterium]
MHPLALSHLRLLPCFLAVGVSPLTAIQIADFNTLTNDRFANDDSFVANQFDLSGVALNGRPGWATMISENVYITSEHYAPGVGSSMTFYAGNDPNGTSVTRQITSTRQQIQGTDIFVGTLDAGLPSGFSFYDFATEDISGAIVGSGSFSQSSYSGANAYAFGRSPSSFPASQDMAVGRNELNRFFTVTDDEGNTGDAIAATDDRETVDAVPFEAMLEDGDSGGPLFVENAEGGLTIVGTNWFVADADDDDVYDIFGASYLGNYDEDIQAFIDANPVPEPAAYALLLALACGLAVQRRRRR